MDQLKKHAFWIAIGVAAAALIGVFVGLILPGKLDIDKQRKSLSGAVASLQREDPPANSVLKDYDALKEKMIGSYGKITAFYAASDKHFERWFPGLPENPDRGSFQAKYDGMIQELEKELATKGAKVGLPAIDDPTKTYLGFSWEQPDVAQWGQINSGGPGEEQRVLKEIQKRFWIRQRVANIVLRGNVKVSGITHFRFFKRLTDKLQTPSWENPGQGRDVVVWPGVRSESGGGFARNFAEFDLPNELGRTMTFGFALDLPYSEVPKVLKEILNPDIEPRGESGADRLLVNLLGAEVTTQEQNDPVIDFTYFKGNAPQQTEAKAKAVAQIKARNVRMAVTCQVIDFEPSKVAKLTAEPPAPATTEEKPKP